MKNKRMKAAADGRIHYTGGPCKTCGSKLRYTKNATCVACAKASATKHRNAVRKLMKQGK